MKDREVVQIHGGCPRKHGALEEYFAALSRALRATSRRSLLVFTERPPELVEHLFTAEGADVLVMPRPRGRLDFGVVLWLSALFRKVRPEIVHCHFGAAALAGLLAARLSGVHRRIWSVHSFPRPFGSFGRVPPRLSVPAWNGRLATDVIAVSEAVRTDLVTCFGLPATKVVSIIHGVRGARFHGRDGNAVRASLAIEPHQKVVACLSQARPEKGVEAFVQAAAIVVSRGVDAVFLQVGGGPLVEALQRLAASLGLHDRMRFLGVRNDVPEILAACDLTVLPSLSEAAGFAAMESLAAGKPVVASRVGGIPELVTDGESGLLVEPANPLALAEAITCLLLDDDRLRKYSFRALQLSSRCSLERSVEATLRLYWPTVLARCQY